ncbi:hypothetical protein GXP70_22065 [Paenibacillus lycopersici]|uniref:Aminoglycoside phosphotransferase domain-containing protein n=1 Tax=Paenibacillus lycopersici TaxID=2704462 RepID=A0A6C0G1W9_9BACL|nr:hypothetical protein [Paenibacillus lycopersici]QHT62402.1 hypothetical protein GXP70_22065 [Paenibacillus lycopersici]
MNRVLFHEALQTAMEDKENVILCRSILGTADVGRIAEETNRFCIRHFGSAAATALYVGFSVGASFGLELENGLRLFMKVHQPTSADTLTAISKSYLCAMSSVQKSLAEQGFPCPGVLLGPTEFGTGIATVDAFAAPGELKDAHSPEIRRAIARALARLITATEPHKGAEGLTHGRFCKSESLYPVPHNALFDFAKTSNGAAWIDAIAGQAKRTVNRIGGNTVLGHVDWSLKHFRFRDGEVAMVYDWDSLKLEDELNVLGIAAATYTTTWDIPVKITPSQEEAHAFALEYEQARGTRFSRDEWTKIAAAATYCMAYVARCEHALDAEGERYEGSFRQALASMTGEYYLQV